MHIPATTFVTSGRTSALLAAVAGRKKERFNERDLRNKLMTAKRTRLHRKDTEQGGKRHGNENKKEVSGLC